MHPINELEKLITQLCGITGSRGDITLITKRHTFPSFPEEKGAAEGEGEIEKQVFAGETLHKATIHLMEARKLLYSIGFRFEENT